MHDRIPERDHGKGVQHVADDRPAERVEGIYHFKARRQAQFALRQRIENIGNKEKKDRFRADHQAEKFGAERFARRPGLDRGDQRGDEKADRRQHQRAFQQPTSDLYARITLS